MSYKFATLNVISVQLTATKKELCGKNTVLFRVITGSFGLLVGKLGAI